VSLLNDPECLGPVPTVLKLLRDRDSLLAALRDLLTAHHHSRGDEYVDAAYKAVEEAERD
jgi:hypothetical protein